MTKSQIYSLTESQIDATITRAAMAVVGEIDALRSEMCLLGEQLRDLKRREADLLSAWRREEPWALPLASNEIELMSEVGGWGQESVFEAAS